MSSDTGAACCGCWPAGSSPAELLERARQAARDSLEWMIRDGVAARVEVEVWRQGLNSVGLGVTVARRDGETLALRFPDAWARIGG